MIQPLRMPQNIEAEQSVIGGGLLRAELPPLSPNDFHRTSHRVIFEAMLRLEAKQEAIDSLTVKAELERMGKLQEAGGASYIAALVEQTPSIVNIDKYSGIVKEKATLRRIISECEDIARAALEPGVEVQEVFDRFQATALGIDHRCDKGSTVKELTNSQLEMIEAARNSECDLSGISTGFREVDHMTSGLQDSDLVVIAGRPGTGKTALALKIAKTAARAGNKVFFSSLEMSSGQLYMRLLSGECGINGRALRLGKFPEGDWKRIVQAGKRIGELDFIIDDTGIISELELARRVRRIKPGLLVVDYLQLMRSALKADRKDLEIANITGGLKALAKELQIPVILLSQLNRATERRTDSRPKLADLRDSGAIEQDADIVFGLYRPEESGIAELICLKHRNGPIGTIKLSFREDITSFGDLARD